MIYLEVCDVNKFKFINYDFVYTKFLGNFCRGKIEFEFIEKIDVVTILMELRILIQML